MTSTLDSDLYGDIYGDEELLEFEELDEAEAMDQSEQPVANEPEADTKPPPVAVAPASTPTITAPASDALKGLPPKPTASTTAPDAASLSYSAQIAKQFSAYQQTPSQERQQRSQIPLPPNPRANGARPSTITTSGDTVFGKKPSEMHDAGKIFIGGLNWDTTDEGLRDYFSQFGKVDACTIMRDPSGTSRGFAFMTFEDPNAVDVVVSRHHELDGKAIDPKRAIPREEHMRNTRYFVGGLAPATTPDSMRAFFSEFGKVVDATVMLDRESGRSKGFGFVTFEDAANADQLVGKLGLILDEKQIEVKAAQPRTQRDQQAAATGRTNGTQNTSAAADQGLPTLPLPMQFPGAAGAGQNAMTQNPMTNLLFQRGMGQMPMGMGMMGMNPMMMQMMQNYGMGMGMGMGGGMGGAMGGGMGAGGGTGGAAGGMGNAGTTGAGGVMPAMNMMGGGGMEGMMGMASMGNMNPMQMGMGAGMGGMRPAAAAMMGNMQQQLGAGRAAGMGGGGAMRGVGGAMGMNRTVGNNAGLGPARASSRGQHGYHPYAR